VARHDGLGLRPREAQGVRTGQLALQRAFIDGCRVDRVRLQADLAQQVEAARGSGSEDERRGRNAG